MLTIQNIDKLKNKIISYPYYVKDITTTILYEPMTFVAFNLYYIEVTDNKETLLFKLNRDMDMINYGYEMKMGNRIVHMSKEDLECMDGLIEWMEYIIEQSKRTIII